MEYNCYFDLAAIFFLITIYICVLMQYSTKTLHAQRFLELSLSLLFTCIFDVIAFYVTTPDSDLDLVSRKVLMSADFISIAILIYSYTRYLKAFLNITIDKRKFSRKINGIILSVYLISHILNLFFEFYYLFDEYGVYKHGHAYPLVFLIPVYFIILGAVSFIKYRSQLSKRQFLCIFAFYPLTLLGIALQYLVFPKTTLSLFCGTLSLIIMLFFLETPDYQRLVETVKKLNEARKEADDANNAKSIFLSNMSHEIRTPLNAVLGMNEMILRESEDYSITEYALEIKNSGEKLLALINEILDFSKIESGKFDIVQTNYALSSIVIDLVNTFKFKALEKGLEFEVKVSPEIPNLLNGDELRIKQILTNLIGNAIKYTQTGKVTLKFDYIEQKPDENSYFPRKENTILLKVDVEDTGQGIREDDMNKLFGDFQRLNIMKNRETEGTGLGLAISTQLLKLMNGTISVKSVYGSGSTFSVTIPQVVLSKIQIGEIDINKHTAEKQDISYKELLTAPEAKILSVDDTPVNLLLLKNLLKRTMIQITDCTSGKQMLELIKTNKYDLIFLDHMMPEMDGIEALHKAKEQEQNMSKDAPYIVLTANAISGMKEKFIKEGFNDYLSKPIRSTELEEMLLKYLPKEKVHITQKTAKHAADNTNIQSNAVKNDTQKTSTETSISQANEEIHEEEKAEQIQLPDLNLKQLNLKIAIEYSMDDIDTLLDIANIYIEASEDTQKTIESAISTEDWNTYKIRVHGLKSSSKLLGGEELSSLAQKCEYAGRDKDADFIRQNTPTLLKMYQESVEDCREILEHVK